MKIKYIIFPLVIVAICAALAKAWLIGSLLTSSIKSISGNCAHEYPVERALSLSGNWFCPAKGN